MSRRRALMAALATAGAVAAGRASAIASDGAPAPAPASDPPASVALAPLPPAPPTVRAVAAGRASAIASDGAPAPAPASDPPASVALAPLPPAPPTVRAVASSAAVDLGAVFYLLIDVDHQAGVEVDLPAALPLGLDLEETARTDRPSKRPGGELTRRFEIALMAFALGDVVIPPVPITWTALGHSHQVATTPMVIQVRGRIAEAAPALRDIAPPVAVVTRDLTTVWIGAGALGGLALVALGWRLARRDRRRATALAAAAVPQRSPHEEALARLAEVEASGALDATDRKPVYLELSEIVRAYAGRRYGFGALDLTTREIRARLASAPDPSGALARVGDWLERCDLVKYAAGDASEDEARQALYEARIFVERTRDAADAALDGERPRGDAAAPPADAAGAGR